jgi:hypothetical protein
MPRFASVANVNSYTRRAGGIETSTPATTPAIEILTRSGATILTRAGATVVARS